MESNVCSSCQKPKATLQCGLCSDALCKSCAQTLEADSFQLLTEIPAHLSHKAYCVPCFDSQVASELDAYNETLEKAKNVYVFTKSQSKETRLIKRKAAAIRVENCSDEDDAILHLAFLAAQSDYNAIVDVHLTSKKIIQNSYQSTAWTGTAIPTHVDADKLEQSRPTLKNPN